MTLTLTLEGGFPSSSVLDRGLSDDAREVRRLWSISSGFTPSFARQARYLAAIRALESAFAHSQEENWDGYGAKRAQLQTLIYAIEFLGYLSSSTPIPEISVDPDGDIAFEWDFGPRKIVSVRVERDGTLHYAGLIGHATFHGTEHLQEGIPASIAAGIGRIVGAGQS